MEQPNIGQDTNQEPNSDLSFKKPNRIRKIILWVIGISFGLIGIASVSVMLFFFFSFKDVQNDYKQDEKDYATFVQKVEASPDVVVSVYSCAPTPYTWVVLEKDVANQGNRFELGTPPSISTYRELVLQRDEVTIAGSKNGTVYTRYLFPIVGSYIKTFVMRLVFDTPDKTLRFINIPITKIGVEDFDIVARCLANYRNAINSNLEPQTVNQQIGGIGLLDDSTADINQEFHYSCDDGTKAIVSSDNMIKFSNGELWKLFVLTLNGKVYPIESRAVDFHVASQNGTNPASIFPRCTDTNGNLMTDVIRDAASRIEILD